MKCCNFFRGAGSGIFLILGLFCFTGSVSAYFVTESIGGSQNDAFYEVIQTSDGGYLAVGSTENYGDGDFDMYVVKFDSDGELDATFGTNGTLTIDSDVSTYPDDSAKSVVQTSDGGYVIAGQTSTNLVARYDDVFVVKITSAGVLDTGFGISGTLHLGGSSYDQARSIKQTSDGGFIIAGSTRSYSAGYHDMYVVKLTNTGVVDPTFGTSGTVTIGGTNYDIAEDVIQTSDGGYVAVGYTTSYGAGGSDMYVAKLTSTGAMDATFGTNGILMIGDVDDEWAHSVIEASTGGYIIAGQASGDLATGSVYPDMHIVKLTTTGTLDTTFGSSGGVTIGGTSADYAYDIFETSDGGYIVAGETYSFGNGDIDNNISDGYVVKLTSVGALDTSFSSDGTLTIGGNDAEEFQSVIENSNGDYVFVGTTYSFGEGGNDAYIVQVSSSGDMNNCSHESGTGGIVGSHSWTTAGDGVIGSGNVTNNGGVINSSGGTLSQYCFSSNAPFTLVSTQDVTSVTAASATGNGTVMATGGDDPERFIEWGTTSGVYTSQCSAGIGGVGSYSCAMTSLTDGVTYYTRAKATNSGGTVYGDEVVFTAEDESYILNTNVDDYGEDYAEFTASFNVDCSGETGLPQVCNEGALVYYEYGTSSGDYSMGTCYSYYGEYYDTFYCQAEEYFTPGETYYVRAVAEIGFEVPSIEYGNEESFTIGADQNLITNPATNITETTATLNADYQITCDGEGPMECYYDFDRTIQVSEISGNYGESLSCSGAPGNAGEYSCDMNDLAAGTTYYARAFLIYDDGEVIMSRIGNEISFTTSSGGESGEENGSPIDINTEVQSTLTLDCHDSAGSTGDYDVLLGTTADPGRVTAGDPAVGGSMCTVTTNDDQGYYLTLVDDNAASNAVLTHDDPNIATTYEIADLAKYAFSTPNTQSWTTTTKGLGFSVTSFPDTDMSNNQFSGIWTTSGNLCQEGIAADDAEYAGVPDTPEAISAVTQYESSATTTGVCYKVDIPASQASGVYTGSVTYTATSDASGYIVISGP